MSNKTIEEEVKITGGGGIKNLDQISPILNAIKYQNKTITNTILESNKAIVEAIKDSQPLPSSQILQAMQTMQETQIAQTNAILEAVKSSQFNWEPLITVGTTLVDRVIDRLLPSQPGVPVQSTPTPTSPMTSAAPTPAEVQVSPATDPVILARLDQLSSAVEQLAQTQAHQSKTIEQLAQGFNTLTQLVAATTGAPSNGSSTPPATPAAPTGAPSVPPAPSSSSASSVLTRNQMTLVDDLDSPPNPSTSGSLAAIAEEEVKPINGENLQGGLAEAGPPTPNSVAPKSPPPKITPVEPYEGDLKLDKIVTADLEAIINQGNNEIYMAAWYNG